MVEAAEENETDPISARRSVNSYLRQSKALFSKQIQGLAQDENLQLPDLSKFLQSEGFKKVKVRYMLPGDDIIKKTFKSLANEDAPVSANVYAAILLALFAGIRKKEVGNLRASCTTCVRKENGINVYVTKNNLPRFAPLSDPIFNWVTEFSSTAYEYLISGTITYRTDDVFDEANAWLRSIGWEVGKPFHEMRKLFGSMVAVTEGMGKARDLLDHESIRTTEEYYANLSMSDEICALWKSFSPLPFSHFKAETKGGKT